MNLDPEEALKEVSDSSLTLEERIARAAYLSDLSDRIRNALEPLREELRAVAETRAEDPVILSGTGMTRATVAKPVPTIELSPGVTLVELKALLGDRFDSLFTVQERVISRKTTRMLLTKLPQDLKMKVFAALKEKDNRGRISFQYGGNLPTLGEE